MDQMTRRDVMKLMAVAALGTAVVPQVATAAEANCLVENTVKRGVCFGKFKGKIWYLEGNWESYRVNNQELQELCINDFAKRIFDQNPEVIWMLLELDDPSVLVVEWIKKKGVWLMRSAYKENKAEDVLFSENITRREWGKATFETQTSLLGNKQWQTDIQI